MNIKQKLNSKQVLYQGGITPISKLNSYYNNHIVANRSFDNESEDLGTLIKINKLITRYEFLYFVFIV